MHHKDIHLGQKLEVIRIPTTILDMDNRKTYLDEAWIPPDYKCYKHISNYLYRTGIVIGLSITNNNCPAITLQFLNGKARFPPECLTEV